MSAPQTRTGVLFRFGTTIFLSSYLLFLLEPLTAKWVLPFLGGGPQIWNTCTLFFQLTLLAGYSYAHILALKLSWRTQRIVHLSFYGCAALFLMRSTFQTPTEPPLWPALWLLRYLTVTVGIPFFILSAQSPILQNWFHSTAQKDRVYSLFAWSNLGSLLALVSYPIWYERWFGLSAQIHHWKFGFLILFFWMMLCAFVPTEAGRLRPSLMNIHRSAAWSERCHWAMLAFVPSSLMLGVTTFITTDLSPIPLLWILPLALYLLSFIFVFSASMDRLESAADACLPILIIAVFATKNLSPLWLPTLLHLLTFFCAAMVCHGRLARRKPPGENLTDYYFWIVLGGALGGVFNAIVAPALFMTVLEYPIILLMAGAIGSPMGIFPLHRRLRESIGIVGLVLTALYVWHGSTHPGLRLGPALIDLSFLGLLGWMAQLHESRPLLGLTLAAILLGKFIFPTSSDVALFKARSFFGVHRVTVDRENKVHTLYHGTTMHGLQFLDPTLSLYPYGTYYDPNGPFGDIFRLYRQANDQGRIAVIGLGTGSLVSYAKPDEAWDFYEIDPVVMRIAQDPHFFTFLSKSSARWHITLGDARLTLAQAPPRTYSLIVLDAFGSDAIPIHLITKEAIEMYLSKLKPGGLLAFHVTNAYVDLVRPIGDVGRSLRLSTLVARDNGGMMNGIRRPRTRVIVMSTRPESLLALSTPSPILPPEKPVWTDDYNNLLSAMNWH